MSDKKEHKKIEPEIITKDSPLFKTWKHGKVKRVSRSTLSAMILTHFKQMGERKMSVHSFRKKLQTDLEKSGMNTNWIDQVLGHELINSRDAYSLPTDEELKDAYTKAYSIIRIYQQVLEPKKNMKIQISNNETILEIKSNDMQTIKQALLNGYKHIDTVGDVRLYMKNPNDN